MEDRDLLQSGYRYGLSLTHREADAEDLVQEAWMRLLRRHGSSPTPSLLFTAIRNLYIDWYRRSKLVVFEPFDEEEHGNLASTLVPTIVEVDSDEMDRALALIRPEEREAIYLNAVEGFSAREISALMDIPRNTVLSLLHRGKKKLAAHLNPSWGDRQEGKA